ncbi:molybdate transport system ATP-binding protein [Glaciecola punicea ACAM 611]|uniref:Molybdate transport system ATP-binding protein n=1 Tax=Glaciecola punicea ACAM 611 TaxID=1121923 RepID=H5TBJ4_9ALTE|nr:ATP-binding cassette domain-containing protein [Glaciecola punicea]GAB55671.1 molybdate transport system ATP-binding protein [Glaciecola punicea ACAM 611]
MNIKLWHKIKLSKHQEQVFEMEVTIDDKHKIVGMFGESGAGKTTMLKVMAGLVNAAQCTMHLPMHCINTKGRYNPCVYIGADSALFDHLNVAENLTLVIRHSESRQSNSLDLDEVLGLCGISSLMSKMPWQLSGGEKQRVCFARGLLTGKKLLLLDEAFSALDWKLRQVMHQVLRTLASKNGFRAIMVSHSLKELSLCASEVIVIEQGAVLNQMSIKSAVDYQIGSTQNVEVNKADYFCAVNGIFSHIDDQDSSLQVWLLSKSEAVSESQNNGQNKSKDKSRVQTDACRLYVKVPSVNSAEMNNNQFVSALLLPQKGEPRSFALNANQLSVSRHDNNQTSMVNCFPVCISNIIENTTGVVVSGRWHGQVFHSLITIKSFQTLNIKVDEKLYFVCKAL